MLSRVEFGRVLVQLTRISGALFQNIKMLRKFPNFCSLFPCSGSRFYVGRFMAQFACLCTNTKYELNSHLLMEFFIFILGCQISHVLRSIQYCAKVFISGSEVFMKSRQAETQRFPLISLSVSDWLIRKHHPIREEQTAWQLQAGTPKITHASLKLRMPDFRLFLRSSASSFGRNSSWNNYAKRGMDNKDPENEDPSNVNAKCDWMMLT